MNLIISNKSDKPIYEQIYEQIVSQIISGELPPNFCLPSIRNIASELRISIITIKKAWELLESNGFIYTKVGKGCFVSEYSKIHLEKKKEYIAIEKLRNDLKYYKQLGLSLDDLLELIKKEYGGI
ncbi:MAG: GntR family transcriptional regulator [Bacilli bacterium]